jgi:hypothetical protein
LSLGVGDSVHIFNQWDWHVGKGDVIECAGLFSFKNCSLVIGLGETCRCYITWCSWLVGDIGSFGVVILDEGTLDKGNHFLNIMSKIGLE